MLLAFAAEAYLQYHAERLRAGEHQLDVARSMAATLDRELGGAIASLQALALSPRLQVDDLPGFRALAMRYMAIQPDSSGLVLLDETGQHLVNTGFAPGKPLPRRNAAANEATTRAVFRTAQPVVSDLFPRARDGSMIVTADVPVLRDGHVIYDLSLVLPADRFTRIIAEQHLEPGTVSSIYDRQGVHVARLPSPDRYTGEPARPFLRRALARASEGVIANTSMEGKPLLSAFSHARLSGWSITIGVPERLLRARLLASLGLLFMAGLLGLLASLGLATLLARRVLVPMQALARMAAEPAMQLTPPTLQLREVDDVADALRRSLAGQQAALEALQQLNEELERRVRHEISNREHAQAQLAQSQRMEALGQLAGGIAHDFNNVLQAVTGGLSLIQRRAEDPASVRRLSGMAADAAARGAAITGRLLTFARRGELVAVAIEPRALLGSMREMLAHTLGSGIEVRVEVVPDTPKLMADRAQLETVLVNLAVNARDAMPAGGTLTLSTSVEASLPAGADRHGQKVHGAYVRIDVTDTGTGMEAATLARASEPFFTTKPPGKGTGLGLAMARGFAEQSGGTLRIGSDEGAGTTVSLWFPRAEAGAEPGPPSAMPSADPGRPALRVLMVDDDGMVRDMLANELQDRGFSVTTACDGLAALGLLDAGLAADVLVSDYAMPGMNGLALIEEARKRRPDLPALLLTGYAEAESGLHVAHDPLLKVLRKPVSGAELAARAEALRPG